MANPVDLDDTTLLARSVREPDLFAEIYRRFCAEVLRYMRRRLGDADAEDATAEVFIRAFRQRSRYVAQHASALPWIYWHATCVISDRGRVERRRLRLLEELTASTATLPAASDPVAGSLTASVVCALQELPLVDREALLLVVWGELTYEEAATAAGVPIGTVRSRISRAKGHLRGRIENPLLTLTDTKGTHA